jgi:hypothetical protein
MRDRLFTDGSHPQVSIGVLCWISEIEQLPELKRCLDSLREFNVIVVSGKWNDIEGNFPYNIPEANTLIESYDNITHIFSYNKSEAENRNIYLENCNADFLFWVDTDEWIEMPLGKDFFLRGLTDLFGKNDYSSQVHWYNHQSNGITSYGKQKRMVQYPSKLRHKEKHNKLYFGVREVLRDEIKYHAPRGLIIHTEKNFRSRKREEVMFKRVEGVQLNQ